MNEQASELFMDLVCSGGTPSIDCQLCGRTHFATGPLSTEDPVQIEEMRASAAKYPDKWLESGDDSLAFGYLDGRQVVWNCPCHKMRRYEDFIWDHRELIAKYLKARLAKQVEEDSKLLGTL